MRIVPTFSVKRLRQGNKEKVLTTVSVIWVRGLANLKLWMIKFLNVILTMKGEIALLIYHLSICYKIMYIYYKETKIYLVIQKWTKYSF